MIAAILALLTCPCPGRGHLWVCAPCIEARDCQATGYFQNYCLGGVPAPAGFNLNIKE